MTFHNEGAQLVTVEKIASGSFSATQSWNVRHSETVVIEACDKCVYVVRDSKGPLKYMLADAGDKNRIVNFNGKDWC